MIRLILKVKKQSQICQVFKTWQAYSAQKIVYSVAVPVPLVSLALWIN